jgi:hypothetical protein
LKKIRCTLAARSRSGGKHHVAQILGRQFPKKFIKFWSNANSPNIDSFAHYEKFILRNATLGIASLTDLG